MIPVTATEVLMAGALDFLIGDPAWVPHPVRFIGRAISVCERALRRFCSTPRGERLAGVVLVLAIVLPVYLLAALATDFLNRTAASGMTVIGTLVLVFLIAQTIAARELILSVKGVVDAIGTGDLEAGRQNVSMIVGRDTKTLNEQGVLKAAIESLAENLSDGVVAPLFYLALGGLPLALAYKAVNTLDSMIGYKNERYLNFGWAAARLDDAANYIPARITGFLIVAAVFAYGLVKKPGSVFSEMYHAYAIMRRDGRNHTSPNSGVPEAAMAGALRVRFGGPSTYGGILVEKPWIGDAGNADYQESARTALLLASLTSIMATALAAAAAALWSL